MSSPCIYQPREFSSPDHKRLVEIMRDELATLAELINNGCLASIQPEQLPDPLPAIINNYNIINNGEPGEVVDTGTIFDVDCCGIIVRECSSSPTFVVDTTFAPSAGSAIAAWPGLPAFTSSLLHTRHGFVREGDVLRAFTMQYSSSAGNLLLEVIGGVPFARWYRRTVDPETGLNISVETGQTEVWVNTSAIQTYAVNRSGRIFKLQQQQAGSITPVSRWFLDGVEGPPIRSFYDVAGSPDYYHTASNNALWVPGYGVYSHGRGEEVTSRSISFHPAALATSMPPENATRGVILDTALFPAGGVVLLDYDEDGNIYGVREYGSGNKRFFSYTPMLTLRWEFDYAGTLGGESAVLSRIRMAGNGKYLLYATGASSNPPVYVYDISSGTAAGLATEIAQIVTSLADPIAASHTLSPCEMSFGTAQKMWNLCVGEVVSDPGTSAQWLCREIVAADAGNPRIIVTNGRGQGGDIILDLAEVVQGVGGELRARTVDQWGRVIENRAVVADDIPQLPISKIEWLQGELGMKEPALGNPAADDYVLHSLADGTRYWQLVVSAEAVSLTYDEGVPSTTYSALTRVADSGAHGDRYGVGVTDLEQGTP